MHCATIRRTRRAIAAVVLLAISLTTAHSQTARNADLARIRADIARLRTRLDDLRTQTRSAEHDLEEADLELGIRTNELQLAIDLQSRVEEQRRETELQIAAIAPRIAQERLVRIVILEWLIREEKEEIREALLTGATIAPGPVQAEVQGEGITIVPA